MTPEEEFAAKRLEAESLIRQHAPQRLQEQLISLLRPAIALTATRTDDAHIPVGASKFGGAPDVPSDFVWPMWNDKPLGFLAQINLEEVAAFDVEELLPKSGLLLFFYEFDEPHWGEPQHKGAWRVFLFEGEVARTQGPLGSSFEIANAAIGVGLRFTLPQYETIDALNALSQPEIERVWKMYHDLSGGTCSQMFGHSDEYQGPPEVEAAAHAQGVPLRGENYDEMVEEGKNWVLLLQIQSDDAIDALWGDGGTIYFLIHTEDLARKHFEKTWLIMQC